jgi:hypothetical protein
VLLLFTLLLLYQLIMAVFHILLSPDESHARVLPTSDENANYLWIWVRRFALYAFFYFLVTRSFCGHRDRSSIFLTCEAFFCFLFPSCSPSLFFSGP